MSGITIEFEKGGSFEILLNENAPNTCKAFLEALPYEAAVLQARFSGEECFFKMPMEVGPENNETPFAGSIAFNSDPKWQAVCIYYGPKTKVSSPYNLFASIKGDLAELQKVGERIWTKGGEKVTIKKR